MLWSAHPHLEPGAHAREDQTWGHWGCHNLCCKAVLADLGGWNLPSVVRDAQPEAMEIWQFVPQSEICFDFLSYFPMTRFISKESYCKTLVFQLRHDHSSSTGHFGLNSNPQKMNPLELSSQNGDGFRTRKMQRWNIGPVMLKTSRSFSLRLRDTSSVEFMRRFVLGSKLQGF